MRRTTRLTIFVASLVMGLGMLAGTATADFDEHPHMLVRDVVFDETGEVVSVGGCVDLANNQRLHLGAHHEKMHFGTAGAALAERGRVSHLVVPGAPFPTADDPLPWHDCASLFAFFGIPS